MTVCVSAVFVVLQGRVANAADDVEAIPMVLRPGRLSCARRPRGVDDEGTRLVLRETCAIASGGLDEDAAQVVPKGPSRRTSSALGRWSLRRGSSDEDRAAAKREAFERIQSAADKNTFGLSCLSGIGACGKKASALFEKAPSLHPQRDNDNGSWKIAAVDKKVVFYFVHDGELNDNNSSRRTNAADGGELPRASFMLHAPGASSCK